MAQCRWHCNYKDFPQLLIRWCFHIPASVIRLTRVDFLYVNQLFIGLFPPEKISLLHTNVAALPPPPWHRCHTRAGEQVTRSASSQNLTLQGFHPFMGAWVPSLLGGAAWMYGLMRTVSGCDILLEAGHASEGLCRLVSRSVTKNPFQPVTETWHTSVLLPADTDWIKARNNTRREQRIQPGSP